MWVFNYRLNNVKMENRIKREEQRSVPFRLIKFICLLKIQVYMAKWLKLLNIQIGSSAKKSVEPITEQSAPN